MNNYLARDKRFNSIEMYTEVIQDSIFDSLDSNKLRFASTIVLTFSSEGQIRFLWQCQFYPCTRFIDENGIGSSGDFTGNAYIYKVHVNQSCSEIFFPPKSCTIR